MRNFKKTLSLVLSVLMLVSCCSVVFSTFATAYTTNDGASANYGVYTYNFYDDATGNSAYPVYKHDVLANSTNAKGNLSYIVTPSEATDNKPAGAYFTTLNKRAILTSTWANRMFVRDPDPAISKADAINEGCYLALEKGITYTMILKYKLVSLNAKNHTSDAANAEIGIGFWDPKQAGPSMTLNNLNPTEATSGEIKGIIGSGSISALSTDWQYLNVTVNPEDLTFTANKTYATHESINEQYITIFASVSDANAGATFLIDSLTVVAIDNEYVDEYVIEADGSKNYENVTVYNKAEKAAQKVNEYNFAFDPFAQNWTTLKFNNQTVADDYTKVDYTTGSDALSKYPSIVQNADGSITVQPTGSEQRIAFYTGKSILKKNYYNNAVFAKENAKYYMEVVFSSDATAATANSTISLCVTASMIESSKGKFGWLGANATTFASSVDKIGYTINAGDKYDHAKVNAVIDMAKYPSLVGNGLAIYLAGSSAAAPAVTIHSAKIVEVLPEASAIVKYDETNYNFEVVEASALKGMTLPRPEAAKDGSIGAGWVDNTGAAVSKLPANDFLQVIYPTYKKEVFDFEQGQGYYDPNNRFSKGYLNNIHVDNFAPDSSENTSLRWEEMFWEGGKWKAANLSYLSLTLFGDEKVPFQLKPNTTYKLSMNYFVDTIREKSTFGMQIRVSDALHIGRGSTASENYKTIANYITISSAASEGTEWDEFTIEFTTPEDVSNMPYLSLCFFNTGSTRFESLDHNYTDPNLTGWIKAYVDNIAVEEISNVGLENAVADSYVSIREEIAANEQTSALRVSAAISADDADDASEIGFIALPTNKAAANWYKFDKDGKLASGALSVKVKDVKGLRITGADGADLGIKELLAPSTVHVEDDQKAYQVIITGLQKPNTKGAGLRDDAISVVLYTLKDGVYTYYFANEVSYDQTMTMYAMAGKDFAKYEY